MILLSTMVLGCKPEINKQILVEKYTEGFYRTKYSIANNGKSNKDEFILPLIDTIIQQTKTQVISNKLRGTIIDEIVKTTKSKI